MNARSKDVVDLVLVIERGPPTADEIRKALEATFSTRATHARLPNLDPPPVEWVTEFVAMAAEAGLSMTDCGEAFASLQHFWLANGLGASPTT